ncbi:sugar ABC transporter substrate-binding protein [Neobacillus drentensis]|uniref:ABC transporter substrate-binding protein n=1 Tax=Neobacillus drentensis TaxID=220684 RepID=UPI001F20C0E7|nr:sugar ABC transporter substrate-binding protein [Neobacillus drentensis]ULT59521.1 sugar ABC transporter substrate-binding protein [Neobacillus drentensis]
MKKISTFLLIIVIMMFTILTGCSKPESTQKAASGGKQEIKIWHYFGTESIQTKFQEYVDKYNAQSKTSHVTVTVLPFSDFKKQLTISAASDSLPDIVLIDNCDNVAYSAMGMFEDITDVVKDWKTTKSYFPQILETGKYKGRIYALPVESNNLQIIYHKDMLDAAGVKPPTNFEELKAAAKALTKDGVYGFAMSAVASEEATYQFLPFFWSAGGETMKIDSAAGKKVLTMFSDMVRDGVMPKESISWSQGELSTQFANRKVAMEVMGPWRFTDYKTKGIDFGVSKIPSDVTSASVYGGENLAIVKGKNVNEAAKFMNWFLDYDRNSEWNLYTDEFVASQSTLQDPKYTQDEHWKPFIDMIPHTRARDVTPAYPEVSVAYQQAIQGALSLQQTPEQALKEAQGMIDEALAKYKDK